MKTAIIAGGLLAALTFSAPFAMAQDAQDNQPAQSGGDTGAGQVGGAGPATLMNQQQWQQKLLEQAQQSFMNMSPEQRQQLIDQAQQKLQSMTPEQRAQLIDAARQKMDSISPEDRQRMIEEAKQRFESLPADQQQEMKDKAAEALKNLPKDERDRLMNGDQPPEQKPADDQGGDQGDQGQQQQPAQQQ